MRVSLKIDIPSVLIHLRGRITRERPPVDGPPAVPGAERVAMGLLARVFGSRRRYEAAQRALAAGRSPLGSGRVAAAFPGPLRAWSAARELPEIPAQSFRQWFASRGHDSRE